MGEVNVKLSNRTFKLACLDGQEARLLDLTSHLDKRILALKERLQNVEKISDIYLMLIVALELCSELEDLKVVSSTSKISSSSSSSKQKTSPLKNGESKKDETQNLIRFFERASNDVDDIIRQLD